jgi:hypothetical protein
MSDLSFGLVVVVFGIFFLILWNRMRNRRSTRRPDEARELDVWLRGKEDDEKRK